MKKFEVVVYETLRYTKVFEANTKNEAQNTANDDPVDESNGWTLDNEYEESEIVDVIEVKE